MSKLISEEYRKLNHDLHNAEPRFGSQGHRHVNVLRQVITAASATSLLDYGCGKGTLKPALQPLFPALDIREYDPAIPDKSDEPMAADIVACLDVMEHIEPEHIDEVLAHLQSLTLRVLLAVIATRPAEKILADGRNAHLIVQPAEWWTSKLSAMFSIANMKHFDEYGGELVVILQPK